jgi:hypothetical protein
MTKNLGSEWIYLTNNVFSFEWGSTPLNLSIPDEKVFVTRDANLNKNSVDLNK